MVHTDQTDEDTHDEYQNDFYEALPGTMQGYAYRDDTNTSRLSDETRQHESDAKLTAILTLLLVAVVTVAVGVLLLRGLDTIRSTTPNQSDSSGSLEL